MEHQLLLHCSHMTLYLELCHYIDMHVGNVVWLGPSGSVNVHLGLVLVDTTRWHPSAMFDYRFSILQIFFLFFSLLYPGLWDLNILMNLCVIDFAAPLLHTGSWICLGLLTPGLKREAKQSKEKRREERGLKAEWSRLHQQPPGLPLVQLHWFSHATASLSPASWLQGRKIPSRAEQMENGHEDDWT